jgi:hypothetical protein
MKKLLVVGSAVLAAGTLALAAVAQADPGGGAVVITNTSCVLIDTEGDLFGSTDVRQFTVITPSGRINHYCHGQLPEGSSAPDKAMVFGSADVGGILCATPGGGLTDDWHEVITPSGNVRINCNDA